MISRSNAARQLRHAIGKGLKELSFSSAARVGP
jgi:hypothetical protein